MIVDSVGWDFQEKLHQSQTLSDEGEWAAYYKNYWPDMLAAQRLDKDSRWQRWGIDRVLFLPNGRELWIDEKKRFPDKSGKSYDDFFCEEFSVFREGRQDHKIGWTLDLSKRCDFIAYWITGLSKCYLLPFELLRLTARKNLDDWKRMKWAYPKDAPNHGYVTRNCAVPWGRLWEDMQRLSQRSFGQRLELPPPKFSHGQALFEFFPAP